MSAEERPTPVTIPTPEGYIGRSVVRREAARLQAGPRSSSRTMSLSRG